MTATVLSLVAHVQHLSSRAGARLRDDERGGLSAEYLGIVLVVAALIGALIGNIATISTAITTAITTAIEGMGS